MRMRFWGCAVLLVFTTAAHADRLVNTPVARSLPVGTFRYETLYGSNQPGVREQFIAFSPVLGLEFEARNRERNNETGKFTFDAAFNLIAPVATFSPGISIGVLDALGETIDGRRTYLAITFRELLDVGERSIGGDVTFGYQTGRLNTVFVGVNLPLSTRTRFIAEHNGARITAGFELRLNRMIAFKLYSQESYVLSGISLSTKF